MKNISHRQVRREEEVGHPRGPPGCQAWQVEPRGATKGILATRHGNGTPRSGSAVQPPSCLLDPIQSVLLIAVLTTIEAEMSSVSVWRRIGEHVMLFLPHVFFVCVFVFRLQLTLDIILVSGVQHSG